MEEKQPWKIFNLYRMFKKFHNIIYMKFFKKNIFKILILVIITYLIYLFVNSFLINESFSNKLTFNNTDKWGDLELQIKNQLLPSEKEKYSQLTRRSFPNNNSQETNNEIKNIKLKQKQLSPQRIRDIKYQTDGFYNISLFTKKESLQKKLQYNLDTYIGPIIMNLKNTYNRPRPYKLDKDIKPVISGPKHPAYPSGHATESYYIAYCLSKLYPDKKQLYLKTANYIAENREYAGVHYKSDTDYGKILGQELSLLYPI